MELLDENFVASFALLRIRWMGRMIVLLVYRITWNALLDLSSQ